MAEEHDKREVGRMFLLFSFYLKLQYKSADMGFCWKREKLNCSVKAHNKHLFVFYELGNIQSNPDTWLASSQQTLFPDPRSMMLLIRNVLS